MLFVDLASWCTHLLLPVVAVDPKFQVQVLRLDSCRAGPMGRGPMYGVCVR